MPHLRPAAQEIIVHFLVTILTLASLAGVELFAEMIHIAHREVMGHFTVSDLLFYLDILAVTGINLVGVVRALQVVYVEGRHDP